MSHVFIDINEIEDLKERICSHMDRIAEYFQNGNSFNSNLFFEWDDFTIEQRHYIYQRIDRIVSTSFNNPALMTVINGALDICIWITENCDWVRNRLYETWIAKYKDNDYRAVITMTIATPIALHILLGMAGCKSRFKLGVWMSYELIDSGLRTHLSTIMEHLVKASYQSRFKSTGSLCKVAYSYPITTALHL